MRGSGENIVDSGKGAALRWAWAGGLMTVSMIATLAFGAEFLDLPAGVQQRLQGSVSVMIFDLDDDALTDWDSSVAGDLRWSLGLQGDERLGLTSGFGLGLLYQQGSVQGLDIQYTMATVRYHVGLVYLFSESLALEVSPHLGVGIADYRLLSGSSTIDDAQNIALDYGLTTQLGWRSDGGLEVAGQLAFLATRSSHRGMDSLADNRASIHQSMLHVGLSVGWWY